MSDPGLVGVTLLLQLCFSLFFPWEDTFLAQKVYTPFRCPNGRDLGNHSDVDINVKPS